MTTKSDINIDKYIRKLASKSDCTYAQVEEIILTQLAFTLGDLGVKSSSDILLGNLELNEDGTFTLHPNDFIKDIINGDIDPLYLLNELIKKT